MSEISSLQERNLELLRSRMTSDRRSLPNYMIDMALRTPVHGALKYMGVPCLDDTPGSSDEWRDFALNMDSQIYVPYEDLHSIDPYTINPFFNPNSDKSLSASTADNIQVAAAISLHDALRHTNTLSLGPRFVAEEMVLQHSISDIKQRSLHELVHKVMEIPIWMYYPETVASIPYRLCKTSAWLEDKTNCPEIIITIPVAQGEERQTLPKTLDALARQSLDPSRYAVQILHNRRFDSFPQEDMKLEYTDCDIFELAWLKDLVKQVEDRYPKLQLSAYHQNMMPHETIGGLRSNGTLITLYELFHSGVLKNPASNPLLLNLDADISRINMRYLENMLATAKEDDVPVVSSNLQWDIAPLRQLAPTAAKIIKLSKLLCTVGNNIVLGHDEFFDCGTAIRAKDYLLAGGHNPVDMFFENGKIVNAVKSFSEYGSMDKTISQSRHSYFSTNVRRQVYTMLLGYNPLAAWDEGITTFHDFDDPVRTDNLFDEETLRRLESTTQAHIDEWIVSMSCGITEIKAIKLPRMSNIDEDLKAKRRQALSAIDSALASLGFENLETIKSRYYDAKITNPVTADADELGANK